MTLPLLLLVGSIFFAVFFSLATYHSRAASNWWPSAMPRHCKLMWHPWGPGRRPIDLALGPADELQEGSEKGVKGIVKPSVAVALCDLVPHPPARTRLAIKLRRHKGPKSNFKPFYSGLRISGFQLWFPMFLPPFFFYFFSLSWLMAAATTTDTILIENELFCC